MRKQVTVTIEADGSLKIDAQGFTGPECKRATDYLEKALGAVDKTQPKPEYNQQQAQQAKAGQ